LNPSKKIVLEEKVKLEKEVNKHRQQIVDMISELVAIPTVNPPGQAYKECVDYLSSKLKSWEIEHRLVRVPGGKQPRFSIVGACGEGKDCLRFHGHYDVVPAESLEQFKPRLQGEHLYGRGSSDMKGGLVAMLFALRIIKACDLKAKGKVTFSIVPDEETGGRLGTQHLMEAGLLPQVELGMLMPEPTSGKVWNANKGALTYRVKTKGKYAHVGLEHEGINAFEHMVEVAHSLLELKKDIQKRKTPLAVDAPGANLSVILIGGESGSGINFNVVPDRAFFTIDRRINPEEKLDEAKKELMEIFNKHERKGIKFKIDLLQEGESSAASRESLLASALKQSIIDLTGKNPSFELCPGLCEIRFFNNRGIPAYAYGPGLLEVSHGPEEYVSLRDILSCTTVYALTAVRLLS
jgi:succinyl-diaminopimelate desuccinylase